MPFSFTDLNKILSSFTQARLPGGVIAGFLGYEHGRSGADFEAEREKKRLEEHGVQFSDEVANAFNIGQKAGKLVRLYEANLGGMGGDDGPDLGGYDPYDRGPSPGQGPRGGNNHGYGPGPGRGPHGGYGGRDP